MRNKPQLSRRRKVSDIAFILFRVVSTTCFPDDAAIAGQE
jgi:hypothetical protein